MLAVNPARKLQARVNFAVCALSLAWLSSGSEARSQISIHPKSSPIEFERKLPMRVMPLISGAPLYIARLSRDMYFNSGFSSGEVYLSCDSSRREYRLNLLLGTTIPFFYERFSRSYLGLRSIDPGQFGAFVGLERPSSGESAPTGFDFEVAERSYHFAVRQWDEFDTRGENFLYVATKVDAAFFRSFSGSNALYLVFYDEETQTNHVSLEILYRLDSSVVSALEDAC